MTEAETKAAILDFLRRRGEVPLTGHKEGYSYILYRGGVWIMVSGDPMVPQDEDRTEIDDAQVLTSAFWHVRDRLDHYGPDDGKVTWADVLTFYLDGGY